MHMRMRKKPNLELRMEKCESLLIDAPQDLRGKWHESFPEYGQIHLELGCGKGRFTADTAERDKNTLIIALEKVADAMIIAMERVRDRQIGNIRFIRGDAAKLLEMFAGEEIDRIYINFCDPWPKSRDAKFRLTAPGFLRTYADLLPKSGQIHFKTDNLPLFEWSVRQLRTEGWKISELTNDLHADGPVGVMTDYEAKFYAAGLKINRLVAEKTDETLTTAAGEVPRIHNAALTDARGYAESIADNLHVTEEQQ